MIRHLTFILTITTFLFGGPSGCYEGPDGDGNGNGNGGGKNEPEDNPKPAQKTIYYVLLHRIKLTDQAMTDSRCFPSTALSEYKKAEWAARDTAMLDALRGASEVVSVKDVSIAVADCRRLASIEAESIRKNPWPEGSPPAEDSKGRPVINLKVVYWDEQPGVAPPGTVTAEHWQGAAELLAKGRKVKSLSYFVLSRGQAGYFEDWRVALPESVKLSGTALEQVDPTDAGINARNQIVKKDTDALVGWISERVK
jgi:hypothetical protein